VRTDQKYVERDMIKSFTEEYEFLAPGFPCDVVLSGDNTIYPSFEHALQASKTSDPTIRAQLKDISDVRELKRIANRVCDVSDAWKESGPVIAEQLLRDKFFRNKALTAKLMKTEHRTIQYVNDFKDMYWGMTADRKGQNRLGKLIESVRFCFEKGHILDLWIKDHFKLLNPDMVSVTVKAMKDGEEIKEDRETFEKKPMLEIGKIDDNDVVTPHPTTSRRHALLVVDEVKGPLLLDLATPNGTFVDGNRLAPLVPVPIVSDSSVVLFGASRREYVFIIDTAADQRRRDEIYVRMSNPEVAKESDEDCTVFIGNLPYDCTEEQLRNVFESCGGMRSLTLPQDKSGAQGGVGRGIAFITFETVSGLRQALARDGDDIGGRMIKVKRSEAKGRSTGGGGAGSGGRGSQGHRGGGGEKKKEEDSYYMPRPADREERRGGGGDVWEAARTGPRDGYMDKDRVRDRREGDRDDGRSACSPGDDEHRRRVGRRTESGDESGRGRGQGGTARRSRSGENRRRSSSSSASSSSSSDSRRGGMKEGRHSRSRSRSRSRSGSRDRKRTRRGYDEECGRGRRRSDRDSRR
jgi:RNA recognition motif-containing protein/predicted NAD-dependent protein-ADP-ribosyltransferase YbiA (DUF1768 family)